MIDQVELLRQAAASGFSADTLEKVLRLLDLLSGIFRHPFLKSRVALKGGTALNLFAFDVPRLSVDIDLNYIGAIDRDQMLADVPRVKQAVDAVCGREGIVVKRVPKDHAGGKFRLGYRRAHGGTGTLALDINFLLRAPLWPPTTRRSRTVGERRAENVLVLDHHELAAGKLAALVARRAARDLFDARRLLAHGDLDEGKLRLGFVVYGGISRTDWREITIDDITTTPADVERELVPMLRANEAPARTEVAAWTGQLIADCRTLMAAVLPLADSERKFIDALNDHGVIQPELLTNDPLLGNVIGAHPGLQWKALNVRKHRQDG